MQSVSVSCQGYGPRRSAVSKFFSYLTVKEPFMNDACGSHTNL